MFQPFPEPPTRRGQPAQLVMIEAEALLFHQPQRHGAGPRPLDGRLVGRETWIWIDHLQKALFQRGLQDVPSQVEVELHLYLCILI